MGGWGVVGGGGTWMCVQTSEEYTGLFQNGVLTEWNKLFQ